MRYELVAFLTGASVMILEIVGARLIAPQFGTSTYVWTAMIGVVLAALAAGFAIGGRLADRYHSPGFLSFVLLAAAMVLLFMGMSQAAALREIASWHLDLRLGALLAALLLFAPPSLLIGMVSPHVAKIRITSLESTGKYIGRLESAGALGSIAGTFLCGYFLLGAFGSRAIIIGIVFLLIVTSFIADPAGWRKIQIALFVVALGVGTFIQHNPPNVLADADTPYARYQVVGGYFAGQPVHMLMGDSGGIQSATLASGGSTLILPYVRQFSVVAQAYGAPAKVLVIGGGAYTFPQALINEFPQVHVDVAEIDPNLDTLARRYFYYRGSARIAIHHVDGRVFLNTARTRYDMVYMDAFSSESPPFQLATKEAVDRVAANLQRRGVVVVNLIGKYQNGSNSYLLAMRNTYQKVFRHVAFYQTSPGIGLGQAQNFLLVASDDEPRFDALAAAVHQSPLFLRGGGIVLRDDYAPIERLTYH